MSKKFRVHIKADTEEEVKEQLRECSEILVGVTESTKNWNANYGSVARAEMNKWKRRAEEWINKHKVFY